MRASSVPAAVPLLPAYVRADGGLRLRFGRVGPRTQRLVLAESGGYRARFPETFDAACQAVLINTGGGMAGGDRMRVEATLEPGAEAVITTQAAEKIYRSQGAATRIETSLTLEAGADLAWIPQESILFSQARLERSLSIELAADARLLACESVFFGRSAMGESVEQGALRDRWRVCRGGRLVFAEDMRLEGPIAALLGRPAIGAGARAAATLLVVRPSLADDRDAVRALLAAQEEVEGGAGIVGDLLVIRLVCAQADSLRRVLVTMLGHLTGRALPRNWSS